MDKLFDGKPVINFHREQDRRNFLKWAGLVGVGGGLAVTGLSLPGLTGTSSAQDNGDGDIDILNYALTLEFLEADFYNRGVEAGILSGREMELVRPIGEHEEAHVASISSTVNQLGGDPVAKPTFTYPDGTFDGRDTFLQTASTFEELGVDAYHGQVTRIQSGEILAAAAAIAGVESRHAAILQDLTGGQPFPAPMEDSKTMEQVLEIASDFIES